MIELTKNMRQKDDQPSTELFNRFRSVKELLHKQRVTFNAFSQD